MNEINNHEYFLNSIKDTPSFENNDAFKRKINENEYDDLIFLEKIVKEKAKYLMNIFENFDVSSNRLFLLGSLDYFRIVLNKENLNNIDKRRLLYSLYNYVDSVEKEYFKNNSSDKFQHLNLNKLKSDFDKLEDFIAYELKIIPKFDENSDFNHVFLEVS